jgi:YegS/Rv2252/BmrU family lipid kinase
MHTEADTFDHCFGFPIVFINKVRYAPPNGAIHRQGFENIVALGGDGTINEVANGFFEEIVKNYRDTNGNDTIFQLRELKPINSRAIMGIIPSGSRNVLAKSLDIPVEIVECCQRFVDSKPRKIDVIVGAMTKVTEDPEKERADRSNITARAFLNAAEIGVGAEIIDRSKRIRDKINSRVISTITSVVATLPTYESNLCEISIDDGQRSLLSKMTMGVIANGRYLGGGFTAAPRANISDGLLDITILQNSGSFKMLEGFVNMQENTDFTVNNNDLFYTQAKNVSIKSKEREITVTLDGEPTGILPATFQVYQNALSVKV